MWLSTINHGGHLHSCSHQQFSIELPFQHPATVHTLQIILLDLQGVIKPPLYPNWSD